MGNLIDCSAEFLKGLDADKKREIQRLAQADNLQDAEARLNEQMQFSRQNSRVARDNAYLSIMRRDAFQSGLIERYDSGMSEMDAVTSAISGSSSLGANSRKGIDARIKAASQEAVSIIKREMDAAGVKESRFKKWGLFNDKAFNENVHLALLGKKVDDAEAMAMAAAVRKGTDRLLHKLKTEGVDVAQIENHVRQNHDTDKLARLGFAGWKKRMMDGLDLERTFPEFYRDEQAMANILRTMYDNIVTNAPPKAEGIYGFGRDVTSQLGLRRRLHFKSPEAAVAYHNDLGIGNTAALITDEIRQLSKAFGIVETLGVNPEFTLTSAINGLARHIGTETEDAIKKVNRLRDAWHGAGSPGKGGYLDRMWRVLIGDADQPASTNLAKYSQVVRNIQSLSKLGAAQLSALADLPIKAMAIRHNGVNTPEAILKSLTETAMPGFGESRRGRRQGLLYVGAYCDGFLGDAVERFTGGVDMMRGATGDLLNIMFKITGLEPWTEGHKGGVKRMYARELAYARYADFDDNMRKTFARYGVDEKRFGLWQKTRTAITDVFGKDKYHILAPEKAYDISDADILPFLPEHLRERPANSSGGKFEAMQKMAIERERSKLATDIMSFYADAAHYAIIEPDLRTRTTMTQGLQKGTAGGELVRFFMQFKSFPIAYWQRTMTEQRWKKAAQSGRMAHLTGGVQMAIMMMTMGYMAMTAKDLAKGRSPKDLSNPETWFAAAMQSGGLGLLGDFFLAKQNRFGGGILESLAGPAMGSFGSVADALTAALHGDLEDAGARLVREGLNNTPFINVWYLRAALDYSFLYGIQEWLSPGSTKRMMQRVKSDFGQNYIIDPSKNAGFWNW